MLLASLLDLIRFLFFYIYLDCNLLKGKFVYKYF